MDPTDAYIYIPSKRTLKNLNPRVTRNEISKRYTRVTEYTIYMYTIRSDEFSELIEAWPKTVIKSLLSARIRFSR